MKKVIAWKIIVSAIKRGKNVLHNVIVCNVWTIKITKIVNLTKEKHHQNELKDNQDLFLCNEKYQNSEKIDN